MLRSVLFSFLLAFSLSACIRVPLKNNLDGERKHERISTISGEADLPSWIVGEWRPSRSAFGRDPWNYCILKATSKWLAWEESPGGASGLHTFTVVASEEDFAIVRIAAENNLQRVCLRIPLAGYIRFDRKDFFHCISEMKEKNVQLREYKCPRIFSDKRAFELTIFSTFEDALEHSKPVHWTGYFNMQ